MSKPLIVTAAAIALASCVDPYAPPPRFTPNPPYPPRQADAYRHDPYGNDPYAEQSTYERSDTPTDYATPSPQGPADYPTAKRTANPNQVISPYEPYNVIDVEGFRAGQLARDPSNQKIFRVP